MAVTLSVQNFQKLEEEVKDTINNIADFPEKRLELRQKFYEEFGFKVGQKYGFGNSELAFLEWEIQRGVLNPVDDKSRPGSPWWRAVNSEFIYYSELAGKIYKEDPSSSEINPPVDAWLDYFKKPSSQTWYRAHNTSIVAGYLGNRNKAFDENQYEQYFINEVLFRVLFAQAMVQSDSIAFKIIANPRLPSVDILVKLPDFYPRHYPLSKKDIHEIMYRGGSLQELAEGILDDVIILPHLEELYTKASKWLNQPELVKLQKDNQPVYPSLEYPPLEVNENIFIKILAFLLSFFVKSKIFSFMIPNKVKLKYNGRK